MMSGEISTHHAMKMIRYDDIKPKEKPSYIIKNLKYKIEKLDTTTKPINKNN